MASAFLGKYASITAVDLIQQKKSDFRNFYESNLTEARFEIIQFPTVLITVMFWIVIDFIQASLKILDKE